MTVLDMRPHTHATVMAEFVDDAFVTYTYYLEPVDSGTKLIFVAGPPASADGTTREDLVQTHLAPFREASLDNLATLISMADAAALSTA